MCIAEKVVRHQLKFFALTTNPPNVIVPLYTFVISWTESFYVDLIKAADNRCLHTLLKYDVAK
jgi:hypothetical protein